MQNMHFPETVETDQTNLYAGILYDLVNTKVIHINCCE